MAEKDLLKLLQEKHPAEFTRQQTDEMLALLGKSKKLRAALSNKLQLEQALAETLTRIEVPVDEIIAEAEGRKAFVTKIANAMGIAVVVALLAFIILRNGGDAEVDPAPSQPPREATKTRPPQEGGKAVTVKPAPVQEETQPQPAEEPKEETEPAATVVEKKEEIKPEDKIADLIFPDRVLPFEETCFIEMVDPMDTPSRDVLRTWLDPAVWIRNNIRIDETRVNNVPLATLNGIYRLRPVWPPAGVLRLSLYNHTPPVLIHLWRGKEGILLSFSPGGFLSAYRQVREGEEHSGKVLQLYGSQPVKRRPNDLDMVRGLGQVAFEIRHQGGDLLVIRGDHELMRMPIAGPPQEVYLEGRAHVSGICMYRGGEIPESIVVKSRNRAGRPKQVLDAAALSRLEWKGELPEKTARGNDAARGVTLSGEVENTSVDSFAAVTNGKDLFREIVLRLEDVTPGTGVFLGDEKGAPLYGIGFVLNKQTNEVMSYVPPDDFNAMPRDQSIQVKSQVVPTWGPGQWLKLAVGRNVLRLFISNDGLHWNEVNIMQRVRKTDYPLFSTVGLRLVGNGKQEQPRKITLQHLEIRPAGSLSPFLPPQLAAKVPDFAASGGATAQNLVEWISAAVNSRPEGTEQEVWLRACAAACLLNPEWKFLRPELFAGLLESVASDEKVSIAAALELVHEFALFTANGYPGFSVQDSFASCYEKIGEIASRRGEEKAYSLVKPWLFATPSISGHGLQPLPPVLIRRELLAHMSAGDWDSVSSFCGEIRYWNRQGTPQLPAVAWLTGQTEVKEAVEWAEVALAQRKGPRLIARETPLIHHPLVTEYSKDGYNTLAEFAASIKGRAFNDACLILTSSDNSYISGLLPDLQEKELLVSWRLSLARAFEESPELSRTLQKKYAQLASLRLRKAQVRGDVEAVDAVTRQFYGTEAAVEAFLWMGDQALGIGESTLAEGYYRRARKTAPASSLYLIEARERLAAAFTGREIGSAPTKAIRFGELTLEPADFEKMASDLRKRFQEKTVSYDNDPSIEPSRKVPSAGVYSALSLAEFNFDPRFKDFRPNIPAQKTDWVGRQMALTVYDDYLLVSDRNDLRAYGLPGGELRWSHLAGNQRGGSREWPLVPMRSVVSGDLVFVRMITRQGPRLECLGLADGVAKWVFSSRDQAATDPVLVEGDVVVLNLRRHEELGSELLFTRLARDTGEVLDERSLVNFRRASRSQLFRQFQIGRSIDRLVASGSGCVICTDLRGQLLWVRKQPWRPFEKKSNWYLYQPARPVFSGSSVIVAQPADESVTCLRSDTGGLLWKSPVRDLEKILGVSSGKIIVAASERMLALDSKDGRILWDRPQLGGKGFLVSGDDSRILSLAPVSRSAEMKAIGWGAMGLMSWIDPGDGKELGSWVVDFQLGGAKQGFQAGPMVATGAGVFLFAGEYKGPSRTLFRLDPQRQFTVSAQSGVALDNWLPGQASLKAAVARTLFPGWNLLDSGRSGKDPFVQEFPGSGAVFFTKSQPGSGTQWGKMVKVPAGGKTRLELQLGSNGAEGWTVVVRGNGETLAQKLIPEVPPASGKPEEYTWLEDSLPQSAQEQGGWVWAREPDPVHSGERSMMVSGKGRLEKSFRNSTYWLVASPGDQLFAWVWIDPKDPPRVIQLKFGGEAPPGMFGHSVFWGDLQALGEPPPAPTPHRMGELPAAGQWVRLQIPAESMGIKPGTELRQMAFLQIDGTVYYDGVGIVSRSLPRGLPAELLGARRWTDLDVDLSRFGGKSVWLRVERAVDPAKKGNELWRKIEVVD